MTLQRQLRWGGLWIMVVSLLWSITSIMVYIGRHNTAIQAVYFAGYTGLILTCTIIHITQARRAGMFGLVAYLLSVLCLVYANSVTFLTLAELAGIEGAEQALDAVAGNQIMHLVIYGNFLGLILLGLSVAQAGGLPRWSGILIALGMALQFPAQFAMDLTGPLFFIFMVCGMVIFGAGLIWIGWSLWSSKGLPEAEPALSNLDRAWGAPFVILSGFLLVINAYINSIPDLTLLDGVIHLISTTATIFIIVILHTAQADRAGGTGFAGFFLTHLGATLNLITAYFIMAQLAGQLENNRALMASWVDIPVGRFGNYMLLSGIFLFGTSVIRAEVFPRWSGWLVVIGLALSLPGLFTTQDYLFSIFSVIGATLEGIGIGWMGWTLLRMPATSTQYRNHETSPI
ncbi:MAG TPA: hypothetical protein VK888_08360 [Anaerolineales bacterium]|nr:hypothetical protein [Anaerolineales bacterium]